MDKRRWEQIKNETPEEKAANAAAREESRRKWKEAADRALAGEETNLPPWLVENERRAREQYDDKGLPRPSLTERIQDYYKRLEAGEAEPMKPLNLDEINSVDTSWVLRGQPDVQPDPTFTGEDWLNQQLPSKSPRPEGLQRVATGIADWATGNKWDFDQRGGSGIPRDNVPDPDRYKARIEEWGNNPGQDLGRDPTLVHGHSWMDHGKLPAQQERIPALPEGTYYAPPGIWPENSIVPPEQRLVHDHLLRIRPQQERIPYYDDNWNAGGPGRTKPEDKKLEQRVWERDQMPSRTPDSSGRLYPDKNDPGFLDPRIQGDGSMTMQYIPELDNPNWTPENPMPNRNWSRGGEGIQYRR